MKIKSLIFLLVLLFASFANGQSVRYSGPITSGTIVEPFVLISTTLSATQLVGLTTVTGTINMSGATVIGAGQTYSAGNGLTLTSGTFFNAGLTAFLSGTNLTTGTTTIGFGLAMTNGTLSNGGVVAIASPDSTWTITNGTATATKSNQSASSWYGNAQLTGTTPVFNTAGILQLGSVSILAGGTATTISNLNLSGTRTISGTSFGVNSLYTGTGAGGATFNVNSLLQNGTAPLFAAPGGATIYNGADVLINGSANTSSSGSANLTLAGSNTTLNYFNSATGITINASGTAFTSGRITFIANGSTIMTLNNAGQGGWVVPSAANIRPQFQDGISFDSNSVWNLTDNGDSTTARLRSDYVTAQTWDRTTGNSILISNLTLSSTTASLTAAHYVGNSGVPTITVTSALGTTGSATIIGTDSAGIITLYANGSSFAAGAYANVKFSGTFTYPNGCSVWLEPVLSAAINIAGNYVITSATGFTINNTNTESAGGTLQYHYGVVGF
jgi:fibronectin-binding autotransporter adhesin